jgi:hypothetical protein
MGAPADILGDARSAAMPAELHFDDALAQRLPLPLAQLYRRAFNAKNARDRNGERPGEQNFAPGQRPTGPTVAGFLKLAISPAGPPGPCALAR